MTINKQIILNLLFEHYRVMLATGELERLLEDKVAFAGDICLHGCEIIDNVFKIMDIKVEDDEQFTFYYTPFYQLLEKDFNHANEVKKDLEQYYNWLTKQKTK